jgi:ryanodine receptor 1
MGDTTPVEPPTPEGSPIIKRKLGVRGPVRGWGAERWGRGEREGGDAQEGDRDSGREKKGIRDRDLREATHQSQRPRDPIKAEKGPRGKRPKKALSDTHGREECRKGPQSIRCP